MTRAGLLEILNTGPRTLVQDLGRPGWAHLGVSDSGAADRGAFRHGAALVGNEPDRAALEVVLGGLEVRAVGAVTVAVTGAAVSLRHKVSADRTIQRPDTDMRLELAGGDVLRLGAPRVGLRSYLSVRGGIDLPPVLGSRSTDTLSGLGPPPVRAGDRLPIGPTPTVPPAGAPAESAWETEASPERGLPSGGGWPPDAGSLSERGSALAAAVPVVLEVVPGPRTEYFADPDLLVRGGWTVTQHSDRIGVRLTPADGDIVRRAAGFADREVPSEPMVRGAIQVPPSGEPVILFADHPTTGGYPVIGVVADAALDLIAQLRPGAAVRLHWSGTSIG